MGGNTYKYKEIVERGIAALNDRDFDSFLSPAVLSSDFTKYLGPQSMGLPPQTRDQWYEDLTVGFMGQNYEKWHAVIQAYWEDINSRSAIVWCTEKGLLVDQEKYEMDYVLRYEFDENGKVKKLWELTDSYLQKSISEKWIRRLDKAKDQKDI